MKLDYKIHNEIKFKCSLVYLMFKVLTLDSTDNIMSMFKFTLMEKYFVEEVYYLVGD